jgi:mono/diheme cytochrome c family protein
MCRRKASVPSAGTVDRTMRQVPFVAALATFVAAALPATFAGSAPAFAQDTAAPSQPSGNAPSQSANAPAGPQASPTDIDGETMFATACGWCHQQGGRAAGRGPKLAGDKNSDEFLIDRIKHGKGGAMPAFGRVFSDGQIIAILAYIRSLDDPGG